MKINNKCKKMYIIFIYQNDWEIPIKKNLQILKYIIKKIKWLNCLFWAICEVTHCNKKPCVELL